MAWKQTRTLSSSARYHGEFQISSSNFLFEFLKAVQTAFPELRERDSLTLHVLSHHICCWLLPLLHRGTLIGRIGRCAQQFFTHNRYIGGGAYSYFDALTFNSQH
jgi:hypothetical protein